MRDCLLANVSRRCWINCKRELSKGKIKLTLKKVRFDDINENLKLLRDGDIIDVIMILEGSTAMAERDTETRNKQAVHAAFDAWRNGTAGNVFDLLVPDANWTIVGNSPVSRTYASRQEFLDVVITPFNARLSKRLVPTVRGIYADSDMVIALFDAEGTARDGRPYKNTYTWYLQMRDGQIVNVVAFFDTIVFTDLWVRIRPE